MRHRIASTIRCTASYGPALMADRKAYLKDVQLCPPVMRPPLDELGSAAEAEQAELGVADLETAESPSFPSLTRNVASTAVLTNNQFL